MDQLDHLLKDIVALWVVIDPISSIPVFLAATKHMSETQRRRTALKAVVIAAGILVGFVVAGQLLLEEMGIQLPSFQVAGGLVLFVFAIRMVFAKDGEDDESISKNGHDVAVFPLAVPSIAGPAAMMAVVLLTDNHRYSIPNQVFTTMIMLLVLAACFFVRVLSGRIKRMIGDAGIDIMGRVMGLVLAALAVQTVVDGLRVMITNLPA